MPINLIQSLILNYHSNPLLYHVLQWKSNNMRESVIWASIVPRERSSYYHTYAHFDSSKTQQDIAPTTLTNLCSVWQKYQSSSCEQLSLRAWESLFEPYFLFFLLTHAISRKQKPIIWAGIPRHMTSMFTINVHAHMCDLDSNGFFHPKFFISVLPPETLARVLKTSSCLVLI